MGVHYIPLISQGEQGSLTPICHRSKDSRIEKLQEELLKQKEYRKQDSKETLQREQVLAPLAPLAPLVLVLRWTFQLLQLFETSSVK